MNVVITDTAEKVVIAMAVLEKVDTCNRMFPVLAFVYPVNPYRETELNIRNCLSRRSFAQMLLIFTITFLFGRLKESLNK